MPYIQLIENGECPYDIRYLPGKILKNLYSLQLDYVNIEIDNGYLDVCIML